MSRPSFRPRPVDIHRRLPIVRFAREFEDDDPTFTLRAAPPLLRHSAPEPAADGEAHPASNKKNAQEIPTPQYDDVDTYERDYTRTFAQPTTYIRGRGARAEIGDFIEYDLDNEDEDWLEDYNNEQKNLNPEMLEVLLFKLEILDHKAREKAGIITPTRSGPIPVILQLDSAFEAFQYLSVRYAVFQATYSYWKAKRERWQKPILRHLQPPPPTSDTNPYNVFRPREKAHRLHTRRMQRRENNAQSFEKLRLVRRNLEQAKVLVEALIKREEKKRETMECEVHLRRIQMKYKHEAQLLDDGIALSGPQQASTQFGSSEDDYSDSDDTSTEQPYLQPIAFHPLLPDKKLSVIPSVRLKHEHELKIRVQQTAWLFKRISEMQDPEEPVMLFTRPLDPGRLEIAGIRPPPAPPIDSGATAPLFRCQGRIGRGGRIIFDRWNPLLEVPIGQQASQFLRYNHSPPVLEG
ncbi:hypothetical protein BAE44_0025885 [Dichanthelium oligosanthes]|uniref:Enhancer of polycomb-like protein n=1 Tax=Dichanthelium oligosanthes TaxID=888268 RepID=A0A1E5UJN2_9POAL|nr:hypothetical protein BAE44_0025885 [Dichanthelium oligosanthes]